MTLQPENESQSLFRRIINIREASVTLIIIVVLVAVSLFRPTFISTGNIRAVAMSFAADGIMTCGMVVILVAGCIDLSVGAVMCVSSILTGTLFMQGWNIWLAVIAGILLGTLCGAISGALVSKLGFSPFISTLAMLSLARGASYIITRGSPISAKNLPPAFRFLGAGNIYGVPTMVIIFILFVLVFDFLLRRAEVFRKVFYIGSNEKAAIFSGVNVPKIKQRIFILSGFLCGVAGVLMLARFSVATPTAGVSAELRCISGSVIGGVSLAGGQGTIIGAALGLLLNCLINSAIVMFNVSVYWQDFFTGLILVIAVTFDLLNNKMRARRLAEKYSKI